MSIKQHLNKVKSITSGIQKDYYEWILKNGKSFKSVGKLSIAEKKLLKKYRYSTKARQCYYNAQMLSISNSEFKYYEGWYLFPNLPMPLEHGFNVYKGKVVDTTQFHRTKGVKYFGVHIPNKFIIENQLNTGMAETILFKYYRSKNT